MNCHGGTTNYNLFGIQTINCLYDDWGNALIDNTFTHDGYYGNPTNGDFAELTLLGGNPINCYSGNTDTGGTLTSSPANLETTNHLWNGCRATPARLTIPTSSSCCRRRATPRRSAPASARSVSRVTRA